MKATWDAFICVFLGLLFWWKLLITSHFLSKKYLSKKLLIIFCINYIFLSLYLSKKFIALHLNECCLCCLLCFFRCIKIFEWSLCVFVCAKYSNKKKKKKTILITSISISLSVSSMTSSSSCFVSFFVSLPVALYKHCFTSPTILSNCPPYHGALLSFNFHFTKNYCIPSSL